jgi:hypothetical protein
MYALFHMCYLFSMTSNFVVSSLDTGRVCSLAYTCKRTFDQLLNFLEVAAMFLTDVSPACYLRSSSLLTTAVEVCTVIYFVKTRRV